MIQQYFTKEKGKDHRPMQMREAHVLVVNFLSKPEDWMDSLLRFATAIIIDIGYGHEILSNDDPYHKVSEDTCLAVAGCNPPGGTPVDLFPFLRHFPSWFPGAFYASFARSQVYTVRKLYEYPIARVTEEMAGGMAKPSFLISQLGDPRLGDADDKTPANSTQGAGT